MSGHHPLVQLTERWLNPKRAVPTASYYNRNLLTDYGVNWWDMWCNGWECPDCQAYRLAELS